MKTIHITKGLPASGKTTWAKEHLAKEPNTVRVNKDDLRAMLHNSVWSKGREQFVLEVRDFIIKEALKNGHNVIVDDTNLHPKHEAQIREIAKQFDGKVQVKIQDFTDVSVEECITRDAKREKSVGASVIRDMYKNFLKPEPPQQEIIEGLPWCIICDIDGTLALLDGRPPYERDFENDRLNISVAQVLKWKHGAEDNGEHEIKTIFVSGRSDKHRAVTAKWLEDNLFEYTNEASLFMRKEGDTRKDVIVKKEIYEQHIKGRYNVLFVFDDRNQTVEGWRALGLPTFQVAEGDF